MHTALSSDRPALVERTNPLAEMAIPKAQFADQETTSSFDEKTTLNGKNSINKMDYPASPKKNQSAHPFQQQRRLSTNTWLTQPSSPVKKPSNQVQIGKSSFSHWGGSLKPVNISNNASGMRSKGIAPSSGDSDILKKLSPVFLKRLVKPITSLQAYVRKFLAQRFYAKIRSELIELREKRIRDAAAAKERRKREKELLKLKKKQVKAATAIQRIIRGILTRIALQHSKIVVPIQALVRGFITKQRFIIPRLQFKLRKIEQRREAELLEIKEWKINERDRVYKKAEAKREKWVKSVQEGESQVEETAELAYRLRTENKEMRIESETLREETLALARQNKELANGTVQLQKNMKELQKVFPKLESDNKKFMEVSKAFQNKIEQYTIASEKGKDLLETETSIRNLYQLTTEELVTMVAEKESNQKLAGAIQSAVDRDIRKINRTLDEKIKAVEKDAKRRKSALRSSSSGQGSESKEGDSSKNKDKKSSSKKAVKSSKKELARSSSKGSLSKKSSKKLSKSSSKKSLVSSKSSSKRNLSSTSQSSTAPDSSSSNDD